jgi:hypothetical protein
MKIMNHNLLSLRYLENHTVIFSFRNLYIGLSSCVFVFSITSVLQRSLFKYSYVKQKGIVISYLTPPSHKHTIATAIKRATLLLVHVGLNTHTVNTACSESGISNSISNGAEKFSRHVVGPTSIALVIRRVLLNQGFESILRTLYIANVTSHYAAWWMGRQPCICRV